MGDPIKIGQIAAENPEVLPLVPIFGKIGQIGYEIAEIKRRADERKQREQIRQIVNNPANQRSTYIFSPRRPANQTTSTTASVSTTQVQPQQVNRSRLNPLCNALYNPLRLLTLLDLPLLCSHL
jgi:hypothetical protein